MRLFQSSKPNRQANQYYKSADLCPLSRFREVVNQGSLRPLVIKGNPSETELEEAWNDIYSEYSDIIKDRSTDLHFLNIKQTTAKRHKISYLSVLLQRYSASPDKEFEAMMAEEGFKILSDDHESTFRMAYGRIKRMTDDLAMRVALDSEKEKVDFDFIISEVERYQGYSFDQDKMSVKHFANIYKRFKDNERKN
jgi:hypothetical protein